jgi:hypothetical protein
MLTISLGNESILTLIANKKNSNYEISLDMENETKLE